MEWSTAIPKLFFVLNATSYTVCSTHTCGGGNEKLWNYFVKYRNEHKLHWMTTN